MGQAGRAHSPRMVRASLLLSEGDSRVRLGGHGEPARLDIHSGLCADAQAEVVRRWLNEIRSSAH